MNGEEETLRVRLKLDEFEEMSEFMNLEYVASADTLGKERGLWEG